MLLSLVTASPFISFAATSATAFVIAVEAMRRRARKRHVRTLGRGEYRRRVRDVGWGDVAAFALSIVGIALRVGVFPLHTGVAELTDRSLNLQLQQLATLPTTVFVHLRWVDHEAGAYEDGAGDRGDRRGVHAGLRAHRPRAALTARAAPCASALMHGGCCSPRSVRPAGASCGRPAGRVTLGSPRAGSAIMLDVVRKRGRISSTRSRRAAARARSHGSRPGSPCSVARRSGCPARRVHGRRSPAARAWQESVGGAVVMIVASACSPWHAAGIARPSAGSRSRGCRPTWSAVSGRWSWRCWVAGAARGTAGGAGDPGDGVAEVVGSVGRRLRTCVAHVRRGRWTSMGGPT